MIKKYLVNLAISIDQLANTILAGHPDETISSRMGKAIAKNRDCVICQVLCRWLSWVDPGHCKDAIEWDEGEGWG